VRLASWLGVAAILLCAFTASGEELSVDAGALRAVVATDPWRVTFVDPNGATVLTESIGSADASGPVGFHGTAGWVHATRAASLTSDPESITARVETDDALGRALSVRVARDADGVIAYTAQIDGTDASDVDAMGAAFVASADERFFGLGERGNAVEHRGEVVESYVSDGPYDPSDRAVVAVFIPPVGFRARDDATYFPVPWLLSSRGYGVLVDNDEVVYHHLASERPDAWSVEVRGAPIGISGQPPPVTLMLRVFAGPRPADALRRFTARLGRQPRVRAAWVFGPWFQPGGSPEQQSAQVSKLRAADAPVSVAQTYLHYLPCGGARDAEPQRTAALHDLGVAVTTYFNPMLCQSYEPIFDQAVDSGALFLTAQGAPYVYPYTGSTIFTVGQFDFTAGAGRVLYRELLDQAIADGHDGWMEDFGEYTPLDGYTHGGAHGAAEHNRYPSEYHCAARALTRRSVRPIVRFQRSGWTGAARCATVVWGGDPTTQWGFDGLTSVVTNGLGMGLSGVSTWGSDIGGYFGLFGKQLTGELLARWVQLGAVSGVMRTERDGFALPAYTRPQVDDDDQIANWRRWAKFRTQLYPYLRAADSTYQCTGLPIMRHLLLEWPDDPQAVASDDEFLFGPDLLAAPVLAPGVTTRDLYLPRGVWIDLWRAVAYDAVSSGMSLGQATMVSGEQRVSVPAPADELPLFVRAGALLPLLPADVDTLADYGAANAGIVRLADRADQLELLAFPRGTSTAHGLPGDRIISNEGATGWELTLHSRQTRSWRVQASLATLSVPFTPCGVDFEGQPLPPSDWTVDPQTQVLRVTLHTAHGRLTARRSCE
jgi:alpha-glucosidase (family GH31 glycosyl hydrolase)